MIKKTQLFLNGLISMLLVCSVAYSETLTGIVNALGNGEVQVKINNPSDGIPSIGSPVTFTVEMEGLTLEGGKGNVSKVTGNTVWVIVTEGHPDIDMTASIESQIKMPSSIASAKPLISENQPSSYSKNKTKMHPEKSVNHTINPQTQHLKYSCVHNSYHTGKEYLELLQNHPPVSQLAKIQNQRFIKGVLAYMYLEGLTENHRRNQRTGLRYLLKIPPSEILNYDSYNLALIYHLGEGGVSKDYAKSALYYKKVVLKDGWMNSSPSIPSVVEDYPFAYHNLGCLYLNGHGVEQNKTYAINLFAQAAHYNFMPSIKILELLTASER